MNLRSAVHPTLDEKARAAPPIPLYVVPFVSMFSNPLQGNASDTCPSYSDQNGIAYVTSWKSTLHAFTYSMQARHDD